MRDPESREISAQAYLARLAERGIEYVFANAGTDFAPVIESLAMNANGRRKFPRVITVPHENVAMAMAHGYYKIAGKPAAVMVHVTVGTGNTINGLMNAARDNIPILLAAGRTPITETGHAASRNRPIHWGQESFDQGGMAREFTKWDYELRAGQPVGAIVDRALDIAMSEPRGPVYLTLPREVLSDAAISRRRDGNRPLGAMAAVPSREAIEQVADLIAGAQFPLIVTSALGRSPQAFAELSALTEEFALPVVQSEPSDLNLPSDHAMNLGFDVKALLPRADVVLVLDAPVPWVPKSVTPSRDAKIIHISSDPLQTQYPFRDFEADLLITGAIRGALPLLRESLRAKVKGDGVDKRRKVVAAIREEIVAARRRGMDAARARSPIATSHIAACLNELKSEDAIIINELGVPMSQLNLTKQGSYMGGLLAGGLGFGLGAALGAKLAAPEREVISVVGDGSYMFGNPLPFHYVGRAESLPTLTIISNNQSWHAVRASTLDVFPEGYAAKANIMPLTELKPTPDYEKVITTCGGVGEKVERPGDLLAALKRCFEAVRSGTPALLNVITQGRELYKGNLSNGQSGERQGVPLVTQIDIKVLSTTAMKTVFEELTPLFEHATGNRLTVSFGPSLQLEQRLAEGEAADVAIVSAAGAKDLIGRGKIVTGSVVDLAGSPLAVAVQKGTPKPDISSADAFKRTFLAAKSIAVSKPVGGGQSGAHMAKVFERLGIAEAMNAKATYSAGGPVGLVGFILLRAEAEIGVQQLAELMAVPGIDIVGPLPAELQSITPFVAATPANASHAEAGRGVIDFLTTPAAKRVIKAKGLEPA